MMVVGGLVVLASAAVTGAGLFYLNKMATTSEKEQPKVSLVLKISKDKIEEDKDYQELRNNLSHIIALELPGEYARRFKAHVRHILWEIRDKEQVLNFVKQFEEVILLTVVLRNTPHLREEARKQVDVEARRIYEKLEKEIQPEIDALLGEFEGGKS